MKDRKTEYKNNSAAAQQNSSSFKQDKLTLNFHNESLKDAQEKTKSSTPITKHRKSASAVNSHGKTASHELNEVSNGPALKDITRDDPCGKVAADIENRISCSPGGSSSSKVERPYRQGQKLLGKREINEREDDPAEDGFAARDQKDLRTTNKQHTINDNDGYR